MISEQSEDFSWVIVSFTHNLFVHSSVHWVEVRNPFLSKSKVCGAVCPETRLLSTKHILPSVMKRLLSVCLLPGKHLQLMYHWKIAFDVHSAVVRLKLDFIFAKNQCAYPVSVGWWQVLAIAVSHFWFYQPCVPLCCCTLVVSCSRYCNWHTYSQDE